MPQPKTPNGPVLYEKAKRLYSKVVMEKLAEEYRAASHYEPVGDAPTGSLPVPASREAREPGISSQSPDPIGSDEAERFVGDLKIPTPKQATAHAIPALEKRRS